MPKLKPHAHSIAVPVIRKKNIILHQLSYVQPPRNSDPIAHDAFIESSDDFDKGLDSIQECFKAYN